MITVEDMEAFFSRPGINKHGVCRDEIGVSVQHINGILRGEKPISKDLNARISNVFASYGYIPEKK